MSGPNTLAIEWALERFRKYPDVGAEVLFRVDSNNPYGYDWRSWRHWDESLIKDVLLENIVMNHFSIMPFWEPDGTLPMPTYVPQFPVAFTNGWPGMFQTCKEVGFLPIALTRQRKIKKILVPTEADGVLLSGLFVTECSGLIDLNGNL